MITPAQVERLQDEINFTLTGERFLVMTAIVDDKGGMRTHVTDSKFPIERVDQVLNKLREQITDKGDARSAGGIIIPRSPNRIALDRD